MELNKITVKQVLMFIQKSVQEHAQVMKENNNKLEEIMSTMPPSKARSERLRVIYEDNQRISKLNYELNALHINLLALMRDKRHEFEEFINLPSFVKENIPQKKNIERLNEELVKSKKQKMNYAEEPINLAESKPETIDEAFELTIKGEIQLDSFHPYASSNSFLNRLIKHYEGLEQFERCAEITKLKSSIRN